MISRLQRRTPECNAQICLAALVVLATLIALALTRPTGQSGRVSVKAWGELATDFEVAPTTAAAIASARLLRRSAGRWESRVDARRSMHDIIFTPPGTDYPFRSQVRVSWADDVYEFWLLRDRGLVTADKCFDENCAAVLDAFLVQLVGGEP